jgi:hypothetical protein
MTDAANDPARVAKVLEQVRAGVRQRQAEMATFDADLAALPEALGRAHEIQFIQEPECVSHRPGIGRLIVFAKKAVYQAFMKWFMGSLIEQQNAFNRAATDALRDLFERQRSLAGETRRLEQTLASIRDTVPTEDR